MGGLASRLTRPKSPSPAGRRLPLASLRARAGLGSPPTDWSVEPEGVLGRALEIPVATTITYPLSLDRAIPFTARVMLFPHDWRDLAGAVRAAASVTTRDGERELWAAVLAAAGRGRPAGHDLRVTLPADTVALHLSVQPPRDPPAAAAVTRALWVEPSLWDAAWPRLTSGPAAPPAAPLRPVDDAPLFSVLLPVHDPPPQMLREAIDSVRSQTFDGWELRVVDDGSRDPAVVDLLRDAAADPRIHLQVNPVALGISGASNAALREATGRFVVLLDHDDMLAPDALEQVARQLAEQPELDMIYSDEDIVEDGRVLRAQPKPGWSPDQLTALMYTCHLGIYRRELVTDLGGFRSSFDGCQDYDLVLRLMERTDRVTHIPQVLYHWRAHAASTATLDGGAKPHAFRAQPAAIAEHLARSGVDAEVRYGPLQGIHRIVHRVDPTVRVAVALCVADVRGLAAAVRSWRARGEIAWNLVLTAPERIHGSVEQTLHETGLEAGRYEILAQAPGTSSTAGLALAAETAITRGAVHVLLLQAPAAALTHDWLTRLIGYSAQPGVGAVGPVMLSSDGRIDSAGVTLPDGVPLHLLQGRTTASAPPAAMNPTAVSGALLTPAARYRELGGLDPVSGELSLIHYSLHAHAAGHRIVLVPDARLKLTGDDRATNDLPALRALYRYWAEHLGADVFYNAGYLTDRGDMALRG